MLGQARGFLTEKKVARIITSPLLALDPVATLLDIATQIVIAAYLLHRPVCVDKTQGTGYNGY